MTWRDWAAKNVLGITPAPARKAQAKRTVKAQASLAGRVFEAIVTPGQDNYGTGQDWAPTVYGEYYAKSASIYKAIKVRADALVRPTLRVYQMRGTETAEVPDTDPLATLLRKFNRWWTRGDMWRATSTYLDLWGSAYWLVVKAPGSKLPTEIWPLRPDKMRIIASKTDYIKGFIYQDQGRQLPLLPDEVVWFRHFNPMSEYAGFSPIAPSRLSADMGQDALRYNRNAFKNGILTSNLEFSVDGTVTDEQVADFEKRLKKRFASPDNAQKPIIHGSGWQVKNLGFSQKEMEYVESVRWSMEDVARVYDVPLIMMGDLTHSTYANMDAAERIFWRGISTYCSFLEEEVTEMLCPLFGEGYSVHFDMAEIEALSEDADRVHTRLREDIKVGLITINEAREDLGKEPVTWGDEPPVIPLPLGLAGAGSLVPTASMGNNGHYKKYTPVRLTPEVVQRVTAEHIKRLDRFEKKFDKMQRDLFATQRSAVIASLRRMKASPWDGVFTVAEWLERWIAIGRPLITNALKQNATAQINEFGLGVAFDLTNPLVQRWIDDRAKFWVTRVNEETARLLIGEFKDAMEGGESISQVQERIEKVFRFNDSVRSERIARTEMVSASNKGATEAYRQSGVVEQKVWLATLDDRTRQAHAAAHLQTVLLNEQFLVGGEELDSPGDESHGASADNIIDCRCSVAPVIAQGIKEFQQLMKGEKV